MPTLNELIAEYTQPEDWYNDVLDFVVQNLRENLVEFFNGGNKVRVWVHTEFPQVNHKNLDRIARWLSEELQAEVASVYDSGYQGTLCGFDISRGIHK